MDDAPIPLKNCREARQLALDALICNDPALKCDLTLATTETTDIDIDVVFEEPLPLPLMPGRPTKPELVSPGELQNRTVHTTMGRATLLHALAHIEFNAINLALDIVWRFPGMPIAFYREWLKVAREEAKHFGLLCNRLQALGHAYGDFPAHNGLWEMAYKTRDDLLARLALVPRTLEARGLDVSPAIRDKLCSVGDHESAQILSLILHDEIGHVAIGNHWFGVLCAQRQISTMNAYDDLAARYKAPRLRGPFNIQARREAGFNEDELARLAASQPVR